MTTLTRWRTLPLGRIVDVLDSRRVPVKASERAKRGGDVPYYGATGQAGTIDAPIFDEPLVLLGEDGAPFFDSFKAKAYLIEGPAWVNNHAHVLRPSACLDRRFLKYYLDFFDYRGYANGTTRLKLTQASMKRIPVPIPSVEEQRRIVDLLEYHLSRLDAADASLRANLLRIEAHRAAALNKIMNESVGLPRSKDCRIGDLATVSTGTTPSRSNKEFYDSGSIPWVTSGDLKQGTIRSSTNFVTPKAVQETGLRKYPVGTLLLAMYGEGKTRGTIAELGIPATINQACAALQLRASNLRPWVRAALEQQYWTMRSMASGGVQPNLNLGLIRAIKIPVPPARERDALLHELSETVGAGRRLANALRTSATKSALTRRAVLKAAFSGRLTGRRVDEEVVEELAQ